MELILDDRLNLVMNWTAVLSSHQIYPLIQDQFCIQNHHTELLPAIQQDFNFSAFNKYLLYIKYILLILCIEYKGHCLAIAG